MNCGINRLRNRTYSTCTWYNNTILRCTIHCTSLRYNIRWSTLLWSRRRLNNIVQLHRFAFIGTTILLHITLLLIAWTCLVAKSTTIVTICRETLTTTTTTSTCTTTLCIVHNHIWWALIATIAILQYILVSIRIVLLTTKTKFLVTMLLVTKSFIMKSITTISTTKIPMISTTRFVAKTTTIYTKTTTRLTKLAWAHA